MCARFALNERTKGARLELFSATKVCRPFNLYGFVVFTEGE